MTISWPWPERLRHAAVRVGALDDGPSIAVEAIERPYVDAATGQRVWTYHAPIDGLHPDAAYVYEVTHRDGYDVGSGTFRTAPGGRSSSFRFTSFGDHGIPAAVGGGIGPWSRHAGTVVDAVESCAPLFHLVNGDLCYANVSDDPVATWLSWFRNVNRSARHRPWMPCAGNHENEIGNGPQGYGAFQTQFFLPDNGGPSDVVGNWYAFTVGAVRVVCINGDDFCVQDGGFSAWRNERLPMAESYVQGYSGGAQLAWLDGTLAAARRDQAIDWVVVCMHQVLVSSSPFNGADIGLRHALLPLLERHQVDLVLAGHEHHYERSQAIAGTDRRGGLLTPAVADGTAGAGTVLLTVGTGGHPNFAAQRPALDDHEGLVIVDLEPPRLGLQRVPVRESEPAEWLAYRADAHPYGFALFDVDPGVPGGSTILRATYYGAPPGSSRYRPVDRFRLVRPRADAAASPLIGPSRDGAGRA